MSDGTARVVDGSLIDMVTDGPCLTGTLDQLEVGVGARPMPRQALVKVRADALALMSKVLSAYARDVALGEAARNGSSLGRSVTPLAGRNPDSILYGRVLGGK